MSPWGKNIKIVKRAPAWAKAAERVLQQAVDKAVKRQREAGLTVWAYRDGKLKKLPS